MTRKILGLCMALAVSLTGCGGGGAGGSAAPAGGDSPGGGTNTAQYSVSELSPLQGYTNDAATHISNDGRIIGGSWGEGTYSTNVWEANGTVRSITSSLDIETSDMNEDGQVVGYVLHPSFSWVKLDTTSGIATAMPGGFTPHGINDSGDVAGMSDGRPAVLGANGTTRMLNIPAPYTEGDARRINSSGAVAGISGSRAVVWNPDGSVKAQYSPLTGFNNCCAWLINDAGQIVIWYDERYAVLVGANGSTLPLNSLGYQIVGVEDMNNTGQVVGGVSNGSLEYCKAAVWNPDGTAQLLPLPSGHTRSNALSINDSGTIVGRSLDAVGVWHAVTWARSH